MTKTYRGSLNYVHKCMDKSSVMERVLVVIWQIGRATNFTQFICQEKDSSFETLMFVCLFLGIFFRESIPFSNSPSDQKHTLIK